MIRWLEGSKARSDGGRDTFYAADTPIGRVTVSAVRFRHKGLIAWRGKLPDGMEIERATAHDCMGQIDQIIALQLARKSHA
jgi:hypothetical protein